MTRILVIGDSCTDVYVYGHCKRLCPDAPVPVFIPDYTIKNGGMARNVQANVISLGDKCDLHTHEEDITKTRYVHDTTNQMIMRLDSGEGSVSRVSNLNEITWGLYDAVIVSDYNKGFLLPEDIDFICKHHKFVFVDTKKRLGKWVSSCFVLKINEEEYEKNKAVVEEVGVDHKLIVTLGERGCSYLQKVYPVRKVDIKDMTGAGDTFMAALCSEYMKTRYMVKAIEKANFAATIVVQKRGVCTI